MDAFIETTKVGDIRVAEDHDFQLLKRICLEHDGWKLVHDKKGVTVRTRRTTLCSFKAIKLHARFEGVAASLLYDVLHDPEYRKKWDINYIDSREICILNPNNSVEHYCFSCPKPIRNRDCCFLRSWLETGKEFFIFSRSVNYLDCPNSTSMIRIVNFLTGYYVIPTSDGSGSCEMYYVAISDPKGNLPSWIVNKLPGVVAPKTVKKLVTACAEYTAWKQQNRPHYKPWLYLEQTADKPRINWERVGSMTSLLTAANVDESAAVEKNGDLSDSSSNN